MTEAEPDYTVNDEIALSSRKFYANQNIVGIDDKGDVFEGYDGGLEYERFTAEERRELAQLMIERWRKFGGLA